MLSQLHNSEPLLVSSMCSQYCMVRTYPAGQALELQWLPVSHRSACVACLIHHKLQGWDFLPSVSNSQESAGKPQPYPKSSVTPHVFRVEKRHCSLYTIMPAKGQGLETLPWTSSSKGTTSQHHATLDQSSHFSICLQ